MPGIVFSSSKRLAAGLIMVSALLSSCKGPMHMMPVDYDAARAAFDALENKRNAVDQRDPGTADKWEKLYRTQLLRKVSTTSPAFDPLLDYDTALSLRSFNRSMLRIAEIDQDLDAKSPAEKTAAREKSARFTQRSADADRAVKICRDDAAQYFVEGTTATHGCADILGPLKTAFERENDRK